jgi:predicted  nucleic acid-binding Zn-ribbon protein
LTEKLENDKKELNDRIMNLEREMDALRHLYDSYISDLTKLKAEPEKHKYIIFNILILMGLLYLYRKQADVVHSALKTIKAEDERMRNYIIELETELNNQSRRIKAN